MPRKKGLEEAEIQKLHTTAPEHLTDDELLLSTFCAEDLARKHSGGWDKAMIIPSVGMIIPSVGMIIPSVASAAKDTGSGLLPPSVT